MHSSPCFGRWGGPDFSGSALPLWHFLGRIRVARHSRVRSSENAGRLASDHVPLARSRDRGHHGCRVLHRRHAPCRFCDVGHGVSNLAAAMESRRGLAPRACIGPLPRRLGALWHLRSPGLGRVLGRVVRLAKRLASDGPHPGPNRLVHPAQRGGLHAHSGSPESTHTGRSAGRRAYPWS